MVTLLWSSWPDTALLCACCPLKSVSKQCPWWVWFVIDHSVLNVQGIGGNIYCIPYGIKTDCRGDPIFCPLDTRGCFFQVKWTTHLHVVPRLEFQGTHVQSLILFHIKGKSKPLSTLSRHKAFLNNTLGIDQLHAPAAWNVREERPVRSEPVRVLELPLTVSCGP